MKPLAAGADKCPPLREEAERQGEAGGAAAPPSPPKPGSGQPIPGTGRRSRVARDVNPRDFAKALHQALIEANMSASDLARIVWGTRTDNRGYEVARNRGRVSQYLGGFSLPEPRTLARIAEAVGKTTNELTGAPAPRGGGEAPQGRKPVAVQMTIVAGAPSLAHLTLDMLLPVALAAEIVTKVSSVPPPVVEDTEEGAGDE